MLRTCRPISSAKAAAIGLIREEVDGDLGGAKLPLAEAIPFEAKCFGEVCGTEDMRIGVDNFLKSDPKSKAQFVHR